MSLQFLRYICIHIANQPLISDLSMALPTSAASYVVALIVDAFLLFLSSIHVSDKQVQSSYRLQSSLQLITFDELMTEHKNPIDQCASLNPLVLPEYFLHMLSTILFLCVGEWFTFFVNLPLLAYHVYRLVRFYLLYHWTLDISFHAVGTSTALL